MIGTLNWPRYGRITAIVTLIILAGVVSGSYRGILHDEGIGSFREGAQRIAAGQPLLTRAELAEESRAQKKFPARLFYLITIAIGYKLVGMGLLAFHLFPYIFQLLNVSLMFVVTARFFKSSWWGVVGGILFICWPFNVVFLNQQHNHPFFVCFLLWLALFFDLALERPQWLLGFGVAASLLIYTRFEDGLMFVTLLYATYVISRWKQGIPARWMLASIGALLFTHSAFALIFDFPLTYPFYYLPQLATRQESYGAMAVSSIEATKVAGRYFLSWFLGGKIAALLIGGLFVIGVVTQLKKRLFYPLALFVPYCIFLLFIYNGRVEITFLAVGTFLTPGFLLILLSGMQGSAIVVRNYWQARLVAKTLTPRLMTAIEITSSVVFLVLLLAACLRATNSLALVVEDAIPAAPLWRIAQANPPVLGNPAYQEAFLALNRDERIPVMFRESLIKAVRGDYRSWYLRQIGATAFERKMPEKSRATADFVYYDDYETNVQWEKDRMSSEGTSSLWNAEYAGRLGAFPLGQEGGFAYKFDLPRPIDTVTLSDIHTQWGPGDVVKMWTSFDGQQWTLRYDNRNVRYTEDYYYRFFDDEFDGATTIYIKYFFHAGDRTRTGNDNRGASLDEFSLAVNYQP